MNAIVKTSPEVLIQQNQFNKDYRGEIGSVVWDILESENLDSFDEGMNELNNGLKINFNNVKSSEYTSDENPEIVTLESNSNITKINKVEEKENNINLYEFINGENKISYETIKDYISKPKELISILGISGKVDINQLFVFVKNIKNELGEDKNDEINEALNFLFFKGKISEKVLADIYFNKLVDKKFIDNIIVSLYIQIEDKSLEIFRILKAFSEKKIYLNLSDLNLQLSLTKNEKFNQDSKNRKTINYKQGSVSLYSKKIQAKFLPHYNYTLRIYNVELDGTIGGDIYNFNESGIFLEKTATMKLKSIKSELKEKYDTFDLLSLNDYENELKDTDVGFKYSVESEKGIKVMNNDLLSFINLVLDYKDNPTSLLADDIKKAYFQIVKGCIQKRLGSAVLRNTSSIEIPVKSFVYDTYLNGSENDKNRLERKILGLAGVENYNSLNDFLLGKEKSLSDDSGFEHIDLANIGIRYEKGNFNVEYGLGANGNEYGSKNFKNDPGYYESFPKALLTVNLLKDELGVKKEDMNIIDTKDGVYHAIFIKGDIDKTIFLSDYYGKGTYIYDKILSKNELETESIVLAQLNKGEYKRRVFKITSDPSGDRWLGRIKTTLVGNIDISKENHDKKMREVFIYLVDNGIIDIDNITITELKSFFDDWNYEIAYCDKNGDYRKGINVDLRSTIEKFKGDNVNNISFSVYNDANKSFSSSSISESTLIMVFNGSQFFANYYGYKDRFNEYMGELIKKEKGQNNKSDLVLNEAKNANKGKYRINAVGNFVNNIYCQVI